MLCYAMQGYKELDTIKWRGKAKEGRINDQVVDWLKGIEKRGIECKFQTKV